MRWLVRRRLLLVAGLPLGQLALWACVEAHTGAPIEAGIPDATSETSSSPEAASPPTDGPSDSGIPERVDSAAPDAAVGAAADAAVTADAAVIVDASADPTLAFCNAVRAHVATCSQDAATAAMNSGCYAQDIANCGAVSFILSDPVRQAYGDCAGALGCSPGLDFVGDPCIENEVAHAAVTASQARVAGDYCADCPEDLGPTCATDFYRLAADGATGPGFILREVNDTLVQADRNLCLPIPGDPDANTCSARFGYCSFVHLIQRFPQYTCDGG